MGYTVDEAIEKAGGFGKYQWIYCSLTALCFVPNGLFIYNLGYFTMIPVMMCPDAAGRHFLWKDESVGRDMQFWSNGNLIPGAYPDFSFDKSLRNWVVELDMIWNPAYQSSLFGALFFIGFLISMIILPFTSKFGRKLNLSVASWITLACVILIVSFTNMYTRFIGMFFMGCAMIRSIQAYILATELAPFRLQIIVATGVLGFDVLTMPISSVYFKLISDDWRNIGYFAIAYTTFISFCTLMLPESPRFQYERGEFDKARQIINKMAKLNGSSLARWTWKFDLEIESENMSPSDSKHYFLNLYFRKWKPTS